MVIPSCLFTFSPSDGVGPSSSASALRNELSASKLLQQHLYETLERSQQLHHSLLGYTVRQTDNTVSGRQQFCCLLFP